MLNEIREFEQYSADGFCRLSIGTGKIENDPGLIYYGLNRAMEIVARHFIFSDKFSNISNDKDKINKTKDILRMWLGAKPKDSSLLEEKDFSDVKYWFYRYCIKNYLKNPVEEEVRKLKEEIAKKSMQWDNYLFPIAQDPKYEKTNDLNACKYDEIISTALEKGKLQRYYLVYKKNNLVATELISERRKPTNDEVFISRHKQEKIPRVLDSFLKYLSCYLLSNRDHYQEFRYYRKRDVGNWCINKTGMSKAIFNYKYNDRPLASELPTEPHANYSIGTVDKEFIEKGGWKVLSEDEFKALTDEERCKIHFFSDDGKNLLFDKEYE